MPTTMSVDDLIASFAVNARPQALANSTQRRYKRALRLLSATLGPKPIAAVTVDDVDTLYTGARKAVQDAAAGHIEASAREAIEIARRVWNFGQSRCLCAINPFRAIRFERRAAAPATWSAEQLAKFIAAADAANRREVGTGAALAYWLFLRAHDVLAVRRDDFDGKSLWVPDRWSGKMRVRLDANPNLLARVRVLLGTSTGTSSGDTPWGAPQAFRRTFARIRRQDGLPANLTFRALRPSGLLAFFEAGVMPAWLASQPQFRWTGQAIASRRHMARTRDQQIDRAVLRVRRRRSRK